jgi:hypothetical protein
MKLLRALGAIALGVASLPFALVAGIGFRGRTCTPKELALELEGLAAGDMSYWDQLECVRLKDPRLEAIRQEAMAVNLPFREEDQNLLRRLAARAAALQPRD